MKGRKPKPTALKNLQGNPGKRATNNQEARPDASKPQCPGHLSDEAKKEWRRMATRLHEAGLLTYIDRSALAMYCQAWGRWVTAEEELEREGAVIFTAKGNMIQNPWLAIANRAMKQLQSLAAEFGMTPSSRSRVRVSTAEDDSQNLADVLFQAINSGGK